MAFSSSTVTLGAPTKKADYDRLMDNTKFLHQSSVFLSGTQTVSGQKTFQAKTNFSATSTFGAPIIDKNGREVVAMTFESQHWDEQYTLGAGGIVNKNHTFTFGGSVQALTFLYPRIWVNPGANEIYDATFGMNLIVDDVLLSGTFVTIKLKYGEGSMTTTCMISIDVGAVY